MINQDIVSQLQHAPITERIQLIEAILQSLKKDMNPTQSDRSGKPFKVQQVNLGEDIVVDRNDLYQERETHHVCH